MTERKSKCNNCRSTSHFWASCDEKIDKATKKEETRWAHMASTKNNGLARLQKLRIREDFKDEGEKLDIPFLLKMLDVKYFELELIFESFEEIGDIELDETGNCEKKKDVTMLKHLLDKTRADVSALIMNAKGKARSWRPLVDDSPLCDRQIFSMKLGQLIDLRNSLSDGICVGFRTIGQTEDEAVGFFEHRREFMELQAEISAGLESKVGLESIIAKMTTKMKDIRDVTCRMDLDCKRIKKRGVHCKYFEEFVNTADTVILKFENRLLVLQLESLKIDVESRNTLCRICYANDIDTRLVTQEGTCTHCLCSVCVVNLPWNYEHWTDRIEYQRCPFCRERVIQESCLKLTFA